MTSIVNPVLQGVALAYAADESSFIARSAIQQVAVSAQSGRLAKMGRVTAPELRGNDSILLSKILRAELGAAQEINLISSASSLWSLSHYAVACVWDEMMRREFDALGISTDEAVTIDASQLLLAATDYAVFAAMTDTSALPDGAAAAKWDVATTDPRDDIDTAAEAIQKATGCPRSALKLAMPRDVFNAVRKSPKFLAALTTPGRDVRYLSEAELAAQLDIGGIVVSDATWNTANDGQAPVGGYIWSTDNVCVYYDGPFRGVGRAPAFARFYRGASDMQVETMRKDHNRWSTQCSAEQAIVTVDANAAYVITDTLT
jgi:hypothetical protein